MIARKNQLLQVQKLVWPTFSEIEKEEPQKYLSSSILEVFEEDIQKEYINTEIVRKKINSKESLKSARDNPKEQKRILDSIRYIIGKESEPVSPGGFTSQSTLTSVSSPGGNTMKFEKDSVTDLPARQRFAFTERDNSLIRKHLKSFIKTNKTINKFEFKTIVNDNPEMTDIVAEIGIDRLIVKVRTERKKGY